MSNSIPLTDHTVLVVPFTQEILLDPKPVLSAIRSTLIASSSRSFTVVFTTPAPQIPSDIASSSSSSSSTSQQPQHTQLYKTLISSPRAYFHIFQSFLGRVYASLAAAQWIADRVLLDVEVHFDGEAGDWREKISRGDESHGRQTVLTREVGSLSPAINSVLPHPRHIIPLESTSPDHSELNLPAHPPLAGPAVVALGGTFDHLHAAHKLLLHLAHFLATRKIIIGVMADHLLASKSNAELVQPLPERLQAVQSYMRRLGGTLESGTALTGRGEGYDGASAASSSISGGGAGGTINGGAGSPDPAHDEPSDPTASSIQSDQQTRNEGNMITIAAAEIADTLGPTAYDPDIQALIVSAETISGGHFVNTTRRKKGLGELELYVVDVIADKEEVDLVGEKDEARLKELKMGSTGVRHWIAQRGARAAAGLGDDVA